MMGALGTLLQDAFAGGCRIVDPDSSEDVPGATLVAAASRVAAQLRQHALAPGEPVHVRVSNHPGDLAALLAIWSCGGVAVPLHGAAAPHTLETTARATGARLAVAGGTVSVIAGTPPPPRDLLRGAALIVFTSGTTGAQKGVVIGHDALAGKLGVLQALLGLRAEDVVLLPLQLTFIFGIWAALLTVQAGARLVLIPKFTRPDMARRLAEGATVLAAVPSLLRSLLAEPLPPAAGMRLVLTGGEALGPSLPRQIVAMCPAATILDLYGSTETGSCDFCHAAGPGGAEGSIGRPTAGVAFRIGEAPGELLVRTPYGMAGYLDNPALTEAAFTDGYFRTGDLARALPDGAVALAGRLKELVSRGGNKISPQEIDLLLCTHPAIAAALTTGLPDARLGETLHSVIVPAAGPAPDPDAVLAWLATRVERFKVPETIRVVAELPTGPTGKASRAALRLLLAGG